MQIRAKSSVERWFTVCLLHSGVALATLPTRVNFTLPECGRATVLRSMRQQSMRCDWQLIPRGLRLQHAASMNSSGLLLMAWAVGLAAVVGATGSSVEPECSRCFAENERLTSRIEQLQMRVGQLEAELTHGQGQGAREGLVNRRDLDRVPCADCSAVK